jgi:ribosomal protein S18 acetylase RimI-like enzyme
MDFSLADFSRKGELTELWAEAFCDGEAFISSFLDAYMIPEYNVPVITEGKKIVSALYLVEFELYSETKNLGNCAYLFAAATKKEYRNRGFMSSLVRRASELCANRGLQAVFLFPQAQNKKLFEFYGKAGFLTVYGAKRVKHAAGEKKDFAGYRLERKDIADTEVFDGLYDSYVYFTSRQALAPKKDRLFYFKCAKSYLDVPENADTQARFAVFFQNSELLCYAFYKKYKNIYYIDDIVLPAERKAKGETLNETAETLADFFLNSGNFGDNAELCANVLPNSASDPENVPLAMLLPLTEDVRGIAESLKYPVYINMFMNL